MESFVRLSLVTIGVVAVARGIVMEMLGYADELRDPAAYFDEVPGGKPQMEMIDLAVQLIDKTSGPFDAKTFEDHYGTALIELVHEKMKGHTIVVHEVERPAGGNVIDLMEALKRSVGEGPGSGRRRARAAGRSDREPEHARPRLLSKPTLRAIGSKTERAACGS